MNKPIKDNFWTRVKILVRGVLFYNTVYWTRASDGLKPPKISGRERREKMPARDFNYIKPRANPRAKIAGELDAPEPPAAAQPGAPAFRKVTPEPEKQAPPPPTASPPSAVVRKKRRKLRLVTGPEAAVMPAVSSEGLFKRLFKRPH